LLYVLFASGCRGKKETTKKKKNISAKTVLDIHKVLVTFPKYIIPGNPNVLQIRRNHKFQTNGGLIINASCVLAPITGTGKRKCKTSVMTKTPPP